MKTEVIMKRELFGMEIEQKSKSGFFCATDLMRAGNKWRLSKELPYIDLNRWFNRQSTKEFIAVLEREYGEVKISGRGRGHKTWIHPFLFIKLALSLNPEFEVKVYSWLYDNLLDYRNHSGDSYKKMSGALYIATGNKIEFKDIIKSVARRIKEAIGVDDWEHATSDQLQLRDRIQENISLLTDVVDIDRAVDIGIDKAIGRI